MWKPRAGASALAMAGAVAVAGLTSLPASAVALPGGVAAASGGGVLAGAPAVLGGAAAGGARAVLGDVPRVPAARVGGGDLYYVGGKFIKRRPVTGGGARQVVKVGTLSGNACPQGLAVGNSHLYWT